MTTHPCATPWIWNRPEDIGRRAGERAGRTPQIRARCRPARCPCVFDPRSAGSLVSHLASAVNGASVARKTSFLRDKMGAKLLPTAFELSTIPCADGAFARTRSTARVSSAKARTDRGRCPSFVAAR